MRSAELHVDIRDRTAIRNVQFLPCNSIMGISKRKFLACINGLGLSI